MEVVEIVVSFFLQLLDGFCAAGAGLAVDDDVDVFWYSVGVVFEGGERY